MLTVIIGQLPQTSTGSLGTILIAVIGVFVAIDIVWRVIDRISGTKPSRSEFESLKIQNQNSTHEQARQLEEFRRELDRKVDDALQDLARRLDDLTKRVQTMETNTVAASEARMEKLFLSIQKLHDEIQRKRHYHGG